MLFTSAAIGQSNNCGFGFTTLNWKPLYLIIMIITKRGSLVLTYTPSCVQSRYVHHFPRAFYELTNYPICCCFGLLFCLFIFSFVCIFSFVRLFVLNVMFIMWLSDDVKGKQIHPGALTIVSGVDMYLIIT